MVQKKQTISKRRTKTKDLAKKKPHIPSPSNNDQISRRIKFLLLELATLERTRLDITAIRGSKANKTLNSKEEKPRW